MRKLELDKEFEENFLIILGYSYRLEDISQRLFFTFSEAVYAIDLDNRAYSFRLVRGIKVKNNLEKIELYVEEATNMLEYDQNKKVKP